ncbi:lipoprotein [Cohnella silvisoli]|uniref:Lipoprotein n=1 Tax=Cohnella silvisoli TaxID=2873699 RepID=A0ABV1KZ49_9BACL|nr:lipoprotein [Cohnella silvisoli]MCD9021847.1 lipoprotein [Cohnella silvisoli]
MRKSILALAFVVVLSGCTGNSTTGNSSNAPSTEEKTSPSPSATEPATEPVTPSAILNASELTNQFGFADSEGKLIVTVEQQEETTTTDTNEDTLKGINKAVGENGNVITVRYVKHQSRTEQDNGRQAANNFNNLEGDIFEVLEGKAVPDASYYLVNDKDFNLQSLLKINQVKPQDPPAVITDEIIKARNRTIAQSWQIATLGETKQIFLVQFERKEDQMLASLVVKDGEEWVYMDYPATYNENSTWRVDDQGEISPDMFSFLFTANSSDGLVLGVKWMGAEGENINVIKQSANRFVETDIHSSRYMSPI